jgi:hypothetical protein
MSTTSVGRGPASGGNENHDGDATKTTLGESVQQELPAGGDDAAKSVPVDPIVQDRPRVPDAARTKLPPV